MIIKACDYLQNPESISFLLNHLDTKKYTNLNQVVIALMHRHYQSAESSASMIEMLIELQLERIFRCKTHMAMIPINPAANRLFERFLWLQQASLLARLSFIYTHKNMFEIHAALENAQDEQTAYALELLYGTLLPKHKDLVIKSLEPHLIETSTDALLFDHLLSDY